MKILNLGCGTRTSADPQVINVDWSVYLQLRRSRSLRIAAWPLLSEERRSRLKAMPDNVMVHDLAKGIPFPDGSVDGVYHSHLLEHLDRDVAPVFLREILRVLKPGGTVRVVVPDLERLCAAYLAHIDEAKADSREADRHDEFVAAIIEQSVRKRGAGTASQGRLTGLVDRILLGDARRRGETHQWMYDRENLGALLRRVGFGEPRQVSAKESRIPNWQRFGLDLNPDGTENHPGSLYMEASK